MRKPRKPKKPVEAKHRFNYDLDRVGTGDFGRPPPSIEQDAAEAHVEAFAALLAERAGDREARRRVTVYTMHLVERVFSSWESFGEIFAAALSGKSVEFFRNNNVKAFYAAALSSAAEDDE